MRNRLALLVAVAVLGAGGAAVALSQRDSDADPLAATAPTDARLRSVTLPADLSACGSDAFATPLCWESAGVQPVRAARLLADALTGLGATEVDPQCVRKAFPGRTATYCQLGGVLDGHALDTLVEEQTCAPTVASCTRLTRVRATTAKGTVPDLLGSGTPVPVP